MRKRGSVLAMAGLFSVLGVAAPGRAQTQAQTQTQAQSPSPDREAIRKELAQLRKEFDAIQKAYGERLAALESKLGTQNPPAASVPTPVAAPVPAPVPVPEPQLLPPAPESTGAVGAGSSKVFNPDIAVIGNFLGTGGTSTGNPDPAKALELHESEVSLQAVVDPYARADFFLSFGESGVNVEEGFVTFPTVPGGLLLKVGKMRAAFGKVNGLHTHVLPWADRPLVTRNLIGGEDGINDAGVSVARLIPNPWLFLEATGQVFRGDSADVFQSNARSDLSYTAHLRAYQDLGESTNLDLGGSYSMGHNNSAVVDGVDLGRFTTRLFGADATLRWRPLQRSIYHSFIARTEVVWSRRQQSDGVQAGVGYFVSADYQLGRRWYLGGRYDRSAHADNAALTDTGQAVVLTFMPSEFSVIRSMYRRTLYALQPSAANEFLMQFQFAIGAHGAHPF